MRFSCWTYYLTTYYALDVAYVHCPSESLNEYLSEANPALWQGGGSADPAVWHEFENSFLASFGNSNAEPAGALRFVRHYISPSKAITTAICTRNPATS